MLNGHLKSYIKLGPWLLRKNHKQWPVCTQCEMSRLHLSWHTSASTISRHVSSDLLLILVLPKSEALRVQQLAATADGQYEISRYPHFEDLRWSGGGEGRAETVDMTALLRAEAEAGDTDTLTDLPEDLQQLQQQLLEVRRRCRTCHYLIMLVGVFINLIHLHFCRLRENL